MSIKEQSTTFPSTSPNNKDNINQTTTTNSIAQSSNLTASATQIEEYIQLIESCTNEEDLQKVFISLKITSELISKISTRLSSNESQVKSLVIQNTDEIINLFKNIKQLKEELKKSKRNFDAIDSHLEILKKKYLDSSDKLIKSSISKTNVDFTIMMIEKIKDFISDVKSMKMYYEKDNNILLDSETPMKCFLNLSNFLNKELKEMKPYSNSNNNNSSSKEDKTLYFMKVNNESVNLNNISIIKDDLEWFNNNKLKILNLFRAKFYDAIKIQVSVN